MSQTARSGSPEATEGAEHLPATDPGREANGGAEAGFLLDRESLSWSPWANGRLPSGRHALSPELVSSLQRARLQEAMLIEVGRSGFEEAPVQSVLERAGTSRRIFYEHFSNKEECYLAAYRAGVALLGERALAAAGEASGWRQALRAGLGELVGALDRHPDVARALLVEVHSAGPAALAERIEVMDRAAKALDASRSDLDGELGHEPPAMTAAAIVGGIDSTLRSRLRADDPVELAPLLPELISFAVMAYLGPEAAAEELGAPAPAS